MLTLMLEDRRGIVLTLMLEDRRGIVLTLMLEDRRGIVLTCDVGRQARDCVNLDVAKTGEGLC